MMDDASTEDLCEKCKGKLAFDSARCENGHVAGFPHIRFARRMRPALVAHYERAQREARDRGVTGELERLIAVLDNSVASINMELRTASNLAGGEAYRSYQASVDDGQREIAKRRFHSERTRVDAAVHTGYGNRIVNIALSPDGGGLPNYGPVTLLLKESSIDDRCAVLRENAFYFYDRFRLGDREALEEPGWRSEWCDRSLLGAAALEPEVEQGMGEAALQKLVMASGEDRAKDRFIELHLYDALMREYVASFYLDEKCTRDRYEKAVSAGDATATRDRDANGMTSEDRIFWEHIVEKLTKNGAQRIASVNG